MHKPIGLRKIRAISTATAITMLGNSETLIDRCADLDVGLPPNFYELPLDIREPARLDLPNASGILLGYDPDLFTF